MKVTGKDIDDAAKEASEILDCKVYPRRSKIGSGFDARLQIAPVNAPVLNPAFECGVNLPGLRPWKLQREFLTSWDAPNEPGVFKWVVYEAKQLGTTRLRNGYVPKRYRPALDAATLREALLFVRLKRWL